MNKATTRKVTPIRGSRTTGAKRSEDVRKIRYAVVGLGYIAQNSILPAFAHAKNSELAALVSDDSVKLAKLGKKYDVARRCSYDEYEELLESGAIDAVFIALPNSMHLEFARRAARAGVHVLCEKPMAVTSADCEAMIRAARAGNVKLMIAYRLHFEAGNLAAVELVQSGKLGEPRIFNSEFTMQVRDPENIRLDADLGGGTLYDIGIYCINAARYLFRSEPIEAFARTAANRTEKRFAEVEEMVSAILRFPEDRLAAFTCSFGAADTSSYRVIGTLGDLRVEPAYAHADKIVLAVTLDGRSRKKIYPKRDQFAAELLHFSDCVQSNREPQPSGAEGRNDVRIIEALYASARSGKPVALDLDSPRSRPDIDESIRRPPVAKPKLVRAAGPR